MNRPYVPDKNDFPEVEIEELPRHIGYHEDLSPALADALNRMQNENERRENQKTEDIMPVTREDIVSSVVDLLLHHFDDELIQVGPSFMNASYSKRAAGDDPKQDVNSGLTPDVVEDLDAMLDEEWFVPDTFRVLHDAFYNEGKDGKQAFPFFDFKVELQLSDQSFREGGCRIDIEAANLIDVGDETIEQIFSYSRHYVAIQSIVHTVMSLYGRSVPNNSVLDMMLNTAAPHNLTDKEKHVTPPSENDVGAESYSLKVALTLLPKKVTVEFRDNTGMMFTAAKSYHADFAAKMINEGMTCTTPAPSTDFRVVRNKLENPSPNDVQTDSYVTVLVKEHK